MLPWVIGGLVLGAAALLAWLWSRRKKPEPEVPEPVPKPAKPEPVAARMSDERHDRFRERSDAAIDELANRIRFSSAPSVTREKVGEHIVDSEIPTADITVRPYRDIAELPQALPSARALDDDLYFAHVAAHRIPVVKYQQRVGEYANVYGKPRKVIVLLVDVSLSMKDEERMPWALRLCRKIIERAEKEDADLFLVPFCGVPLKTEHADSSKERTALVERLSAVLALGEGTDINAALLAGLDIVSEPSFTERRMQLVTDGTQGVSVEFVRAKLAELKTELNTVCIGEDNLDLRAVSHRFDLFA